MLSRPPLSPHLLLALANLFWAGNWVVGRAVREDVPPIALAFWRWVIAFVLFVPLAWPHLKREWRTARAAWRRLLLFGLIGTGAYNVLAYQGLALTTATNALLLNSATPVMIVALAWLVFGKRIGAHEAIGILVSLAGVLAIVAQGEPSALLALRLNPGDFWVLASVAAWSLYTCLLPSRPAGLHPLSFLVCIAAIGLVFMLPLYAWEVGQGRLVRPGPASASAIAYAGLFSAFLGYILWNRGVMEVGASTAGLFMHLMPAFGIVLSIVFLGERPAPFHAVGIALIVAGIVLTSRARD